MTAGAQARELSPALRDATADQAAARLALAGALAAGPVHAYLFAGPAGSGKRAAARAFAAEILAIGAPDPDDARRRAALDPSPHPDLVWLVPPGTQHLVADVRDQVIRAAAYRPFEGERRVFVIEAAEAMMDEGQNALLKTLEEPADFAHLILITSEPAALLETVISRCQEVRFAPLRPEVVAQRLGAEGGAGDEATAAARLSGGDTERARFLISDQGRELRDRAVASARAARAGELADRPWEGMLAAADAAGEAAGEQVAAAMTEAAEGVDAREARKRRGEAEEAAKRATRARRTQLLDLALAISGSWFRDLAAVAESAPELALNLDRGDELRADADGLDGPAARRAAELVEKTRRDLQVNVSEQLALEALFYRAEAELR